MRVGSTSRLLEVLRGGARRHPDRIAYTFLKDGEEELGSLTFGELDRRAAALAAYLQNLGEEPGVRALLLFPPGLDFVVAFLACLYSGTIAVPAYPPKPGRKGALDPRLEAIAADARPSLVLTESTLFQRHLEQRESTEGLPGPLGAARWLAIDRLPRSASPQSLSPRQLYREDDPSGSDPLAFLQYTSGSTAAPKGVMVTHANLLANESLIQRAFRTSEDSVVVSWLPLYHDMGLIGGVLHPLALGARCILMSPMAFLQKPARWLRAISRYRGTTSGGPNFAYDLCARRVRDEQLEGVDLSTWAVAFNGAEPVRGETLRRFAERFAGAGFRRRAFYPCYGLAEATLFVTGPEIDEEPEIGAFQAEALQEDRALEACGGGDAVVRQLVSSGTVREGQELWVVDPSSHRSCAPGGIGEIWLAGESIARGYWKQPEATTREFGARLEDVPSAGPFLRTGDLGFLQEGRLFVTGRLKDLVILRGRNHYPQDLERTAEKAHESLRLGCSAAFAVDHDGEERLVLLMEVARRASRELATADEEEAQEIFDAVRRALAEENEVAVFDIVLLEAGTILKTSSGKIRRRACRRAYEGGELRELARSSRPVVGKKAVLQEKASREISKEISSSESLLNSLDGAERKAFLQVLLLQVAAQALRVSPDQLDRDRPLTVLGLDSLAAVEVQHGIQERLGLEISLARLLEGTTLRQLAEELGETEQGPKETLPEIWSLEAPSLEDPPLEDPPLEDRGLFSLSQGQRALWFLQRLAPESAAYNVAAGLRVSTPLDVGVLQQAFVTLAQRHGALRTTFVEEEGEPRRRVSAAPLDGMVRSVAGAQEAEDFEEQLRQAAFEPFDLESGPLIRVTVLEGAPGDGSLVVLALHHLVTDFWSLATLARELAEVYGALVAGEEVSPPPSLAAYSTFVSWQENLLQGPLGDELWAYWQDRLKGAPRELALATDRPRPPVQTFAGALRNRHLAVGTAAAADALQRVTGTTLYTVLLTAFFALLHRLTGQRDILLGTPTAGRPHAALSLVQGYFVNPVVLRSEIDGDPTFGDLLETVRRTVLGAFEHQELPFPLLTERLQPQRDPSRPPLIPGLFLQQKAQISELESLTACALGEAGVPFSLGALEVESMRLPEAVSAFDFSLRLGRVAGRLIASWELNRDLFDPTTAERWLGAYDVLLGAAAGSPDARLQDLPLLASAQRHQLLVEWSEPSGELVPSRLLHLAFEEQARLRPQAPALMAQGGEGEPARVVTYGDLNRRAEALARSLRALGVGAAVGEVQTVGVLLKRTPRLIEALLAVLKAGGAYVPLDPTYPEERIRFMVEDSSARVALVDSDAGGSVLHETSTGARIVGLDALPEPATGELESPAGGWHPSRLAYVIYTSGSTGRPKGVALEHRSASAMVEWGRGEFSSEELSGVLAATSVCFDLSVFEIFLPLSVGGCVVLAENALELPRLAAADHVRLINTVPSAMAALVDSGGVPEGVRTINLAGEALRGDLVDAVYEIPSVERVLNLYGPSEDTTYSTFVRVPRQRSGEPTIGRPVAGGRAYVLDGFGGPVPAGIPGELVLGGVGLARGYFGRRALTAERFVPDALSGRFGERLYRTGDLVRLRSDGELLFLGRRDHQVKIRGFRVELGEIEAALLRVALVGEAVVSALALDPGRPEDLSIVAYISLQREKDSGAGAESSDLEGYLREELSQTLPHSMMPARFVVLAALPRTANGKVDRKALPLPQREELSAGRPRSPLEEVLSGMWADLLGVPAPGPEANFFDLGGHSLMAARLVARIRHSLQADLALGEIFQAQTLEALARRVEAARGEATATSLERRPLPDGEEVRWPLSFHQQRLWFLSRWSPNSAAYNVYAAVRLRGSLRLAGWSAALEEIVRRHAVLRSVFVAQEATGEDGPEVLVRAHSTLVVPLVDLRGLSALEREEALRRLSRREAQRPFDLRQGPLIRPLLIRMGGEDHTFLLNLHHIVSDGWSQGILLREIAALYEVAEPQRALPELPLQYGDFARWQRRELGRETLESRLVYWREALDGAPQSLELPFDRPRPTHLSEVGGSHRFVLPTALVGGLTALGRNRGAATPAMVLLAGFGVLLSRLTGQRDLLLGAPVANRPDPRLEGLVGFFVNTAVRRLRLGSRQDFLSLVEQVKEETLASYPHEDLPFELLVEALAVQRDLQRNPLVQVLFGYQNVPQPPLEIGGLALEQLSGDPVDTGTSKFDLSLFLFEEKDPTSGDDRLEGILEYDSDLFDGSTVQRFAKSLETVLAAAVEQPDVPVLELPVVTAGERQQLILEWNDTSESFVGEAGNLVDLVALQAARTPAAPAVEAEARSLTYDELMTRAQQLAGALERLGVVRGDVVGLCLERSLDQPVALLATLIVGAAALPLDPAYPPARLELMVEDSGCRVVVTDPTILEAHETVEQLPASVVALERLTEAVSNAPSFSRATKADLAYVIYTSGSTGRPKGVAMTHGAMVNLLHWQRISFGEPAAARTLQFSALSFDVSFQEVFSCWGTGGTLVVMPASLREDATALPAFLTTRRIERIFLPYVALQQLAETALGDDSFAPPLRDVVTAGEQPRVGPAMEALFHRLPACRFWNHYGPSETHVITSWRAQGAPEEWPRLPPMGRPVAESRCHVLAEGFEPVPVGVAGELLLAGANLARGYLRRPGLTAERFLPDPFAERPGERLYRTGDLALWRPDGALVFLGRRDHQVKIRGHRVELGEIEHRMEVHSAVRECAVVSRPGAGGDRLVAYWVAEPSVGTQPSTEELRKHVAAELPDPMVPAFFVSLEALPLTASGKVDRRRLPDPDPSLLPRSAAYIAPRTPTEEILAGLWADLLEVDQVGLDDDFFDLGGHSLLATRVVSRIARDLGAEVPLRSLFEGPTVRSLAATVDNATRGGLERIPVAERKGDPPLSFGQQRLWFLHRMSPESASYNMHGALRLQGPVRVAVLEHCLQEIGRRHETLRTTFPEVDGQPVQRIAKEARIPLPVVDMSALIEGEAEAWRISRRQGQRPYDLVAGPLARATLIRLEREKHLLLLDLHHIISDGWSHGVAFRELSDLYAAFSSSASDISTPQPPLPPLALQYADFALWQRDYLRGEVLEGLFAYWRRQLEGMPDALQLPADRPRPARLSFLGGIRRRPLSPELVASVGGLARRCRATPAMVLLTAFTGLLARFTGQRDIPVGMAIANRNRRELEDLIGFFVNALVARTKLGRRQSVEELVRRVREVSLEAYAHQDLPFDRLVEELAPERRLDRDPLVQVLFGYQNFPRAELEIEGIVLEPVLRGELVDTGTSKFDLTLFVYEEGESLDILLEYNRELFDGTTMERFLGHFTAFLQGAAATPSIAWDDLDLLGAGERHQVVVESNDTTVVGRDCWSVSAAFEEQVRRSPAAIAVEAPEGTLTYGELDLRSARVARALLARGLASEDLVGVTLERSAALIVALLGILRAGGAYLPLDPDLPPARQGTMVREGRPRLLITGSEGGARLPEGVATPESLILKAGGELGERDAAGDSPRGLPSVGGGNLVYVLYTSGSSGRPKGVAVVHKAVVRLVREVSTIHLGADETFLLLAPVSFDVSTLEIWAPLLNGGRLVVLPPGAPSLEELAAYVTDHGVTTLWLPAGLFHQMVDGPFEKLTTVRQLLAGGDVLSPDHVRRAQKALPACRFINGYGPTENTTFTSYEVIGEVPLGASVPIGRPVVDTRIYVVDEELRVLPTGAPGALLTGGLGLARGYLRQPRLTAERFLPDPFADSPGQRLYHTGDLARWSSGGALEFLGRRDDQVKVRGFRIELGEIDTHLTDHPTVQKAAVLALDEAGGSGGKRLVAYIVPEPDAITADTSVEAAQEQEDQFSRWEMIFDDLYQGEASEADPTFNIIGWESTYSGEALPASEMTEWLEDTVGAIEELAPRRVLEIGCGTGMILFRIAPSCELYVGTDVSQTALEYLGAQLRGLPEPPASVRLEHRWENHFTGVEPGSLDTVILNSVVQYFPTVEVLREVLIQALDALAPGGSIFLGDLRSHPLARTFYTSLELFQAPRGTPLETLRRQVLTREIHEEELLVAPAFFHDLQAEDLRIRRVEVRLKKGRAHNELTGYRYQVVLRVGEQEESFEAETWTLWDEIGSLDELVRQLEEDRPEALALRGVPNARVAEDAAAASLLYSGQDVDSLAELRRRAAAVAREAVEPEDILQAAQRCGYTAEIGWANPGAEGSFEVVFLRGKHDPEACRRILFSKASALVVDAEAPLGNQPLLGRYAQRMARDLRPFLGERLPEYMVPSAFVALASLPLNINGKVDRRALPAPGLTRLQLGEIHVEPATPAETMLAHLWADLLGLEKVSVEDDFFGLGGHSLLATQIVARVRRDFEIEVPLRAFFEAPTVRGLARMLEEGDGSAPRAELPPVEAGHRGQAAPLSFAQERLWFLHRLEPESTVYNEANGFEMEGELRSEALEASLAAIVRRHEILRTTFPEVRGRAMQKVASAESASPFLPVLDLGALPRKQGEEEALRLGATLARFPFDLAVGPLLRTALVRRRSMEHALLFSCHHIVFDGWSAGIFARELSTLYGAFATDTLKPLPELAVQYGDFALWQRRWLTDEALEPQLAYWREQLLGVPAVLDLPTDRPLPPKPSHRGSRIPMRLRASVVEALRKLSGEQKGTLFMALLAGLSLLLGRWSHQRTVVIGSPIANRTRTEIEDLIGFFVNTLALRTDLGNPADQSSFRDLLDQVRETTLGALGHQDLPFERLVEELQPERSLAGTPFFRVLFALQKSSREDLRLAGLEWRPLPVDAGAAKFDLSLTLEETGAGEVAGWWEVSEDLFDATTIRRLGQHLEQLLSAAVAPPDRSMEELESLPVAESHQLRAEWNDIPGAAAPDSCLHELVLLQAQRTPRRPALIWEEQTWSYSRLEEEVQRIAEHLRHEGVGPEVRVGVCLPRGPELVAVMLGVLAAGGAYVPLDPSLPAQRLAFIAEDSGAKLEIVAGEDKKEARGSASTPRLTVEQFQGAALERSSLVRRARSENLAYVIYTSGSTGRPKGVAIQHSSAVRMVSWARQTFSPEDLQGMLASTSTGFDLSVFELFAPLACGGTVILARDALELAEMPRADEVRLLNTVPSAFRELLRLGAVPPSVKTVNLAGEALRRSLVEGAANLGTVERLFNLYGPSEDTTYSTVSRVPLKGAEEPTIGRPVTGSRAYLLDGQLRPVGLGVSGEIYLAGEGLARGYLGQPALTSKRFVPDPFGDAGERIYRTGDLARYRRDGELEFQGRLDHQVKLRGFRIELGEIEAALADLEEIAEVVVTARQDRDDDPQLTAYLTPSGEDRPGALDLREGLRQRLPEYMLPSEFLWLEALPLTANGKVDRKRLPAPESSLGAAVAGASEAPATPTEEVIAGVWCEVLDRPFVGRRESFFDLGGHSLKATRVTSRLAEIWQREVPVRLLFEEPTVAGIARAMEESSSLPVLPPLVARSPGAGPPPASFSQERLWFMDRFEVEAALYSLPLAVRLEGALDHPALVRALEAVVARHDSLRTTFAASATTSGVVQVVASKSEVFLPWVDLRNLDQEPDKVARSLCEAEVRRPFDLAQDPLMRTLLLRLSDDVHVLVVNQHHVISDGWSLGLLADELAACYGAFVAGEMPQLPPLEVQFGDFAAWQRDWLQGDILEQQLTHWRRQMAGAPELLELPTDRPRPALQSYRGAHLEIRWPEHLRQAAGALARESGTSIFMTLLGVYQTLLGRLSNTGDVAVGSTIANRRQVALERLIGFFVNTLVLRTQVAEAGSFLEVLARVREVCLEAYAHQDVPFEKLVEELKPERNLSHTPLFQVVFMLQNVPPPRQSFAGLERRLLPLDTGTSKFDLIVSMVEPGDGLEATVEYNRDLFDRTTIVRWMGLFASLLESAAAEPQRRPEDLPWLAEAERHHLLTEWNDTARSAQFAPYLHHPFEEQARFGPDRPAVLTTGSSITYGELNGRANRLAHALRRQGIGPGDYVGVHLGRRPAMVVAVLAILKAGAAYVPLESTWPMDRIRWIVERQGIRSLVSEGSRLQVLEDGLAQSPLERVLVEDTISDTSSGTAVEVISVASSRDLPSTDLGAIVGPEDVAYVIFTSGSTGRPKGVVERHRPAVNLVSWVNETFAVGPEDRLLFITALSFDLSVYDIFGILAAGGSVRLASEEEVANPARLVEILETEPVTFWDSAPAALQQCVPAFPRQPSAAALRLVFLSGDWIPVPLPDRVRGAFPKAQVISLGGATEATIWSNFHVVRAVDPTWTSIPYGRPIWNARYHVLDHRLAPVPVGVAGDLYITGDCLSTGYAEAPAQTAQQYLPSPLAEDPGERLYRTGDRARYRQGGDLEFLGRLDNQVKVRGFRIELGEIETVLTRHEAVRDCTVLVWEDTPGDQRLVAYWIRTEEALTEGEGGSGGQLRAFLGTRLPEYMLPSSFLELDAWPTTATGKLDRKALLALRSAGHSSSSQAADGPESLSEMEALVGEVWKDIVGLNHVGRRDNFFQLGGHSLLMARVQGRLQQLLGRPIPIVDLFQYPTVETLAKHLGGTPQKESSSSLILGARPERAVSGKIAIIGMDGRFPGSRNLEAFWRNLRDGVESIRFFSDEELLAAGVDAATLRDPRWVKARGALEDPDLFDAAFFDITPREAQILDPQQRLFLETAWNALENAGYAPSRLSSEVGVFGGVSQNTYLHELMAEESLVAAMGLQQLILSNGNDYLPTRVSYKLNLRGPSVNVQTACSTSLVAVHMACNSLLQDDCEIALAGGSTVRSREVWGYPYEEGGIASPDGHTRAFDAQAQGVVSGSGVGVVVLKRLEDAVRDGDFVHAVILGSAINNDGSGKVGFTAPSVEGQARAIAQAYASAGADPRSVSYVEGHGTATPMGDPIEIAALTRAYRSATADSGFCALGSVKTNVGHLDAAAGVAGLMKTVLALEHRQMPPSLHYKEPNPEIDFATSPFFVNAELRPWEASEAPRRAAVSSFGIGGTNAHVVLEEAPPRAPGESSRPVQALRISAQTPMALETRCLRLADWLEETPSLDLADIAYTLRLGREDFQHRRIVLCNSTASAVSALRGDASAAVHSAFLEGDARTPQVAFLFPGQGAQYSGMSAELYEKEPVFRQHLDRCAEILEPHLGGGSSLVEIIFGSTLEAEAKLAQTAFTQPALFSVEVALAELWRSWGVVPEILLGHSLGEYVAAHLAGVFSLEAALQLVVLRGRLMGSQKAGGMVALDISEGNAAPYLGDGIELAAVNGPEACVLSGPLGPIAALEARLGDEGVRHRRLETSHAFHSAMMEPALEAFQEAVAGAAPQPPTIPFISNVSGAPITEAEACAPAYWSSQMRRTVRFSEGLAHLVRVPGRVLLEVGPGHTLSRLAQRHSEAKAAVAIVSSLASPKDSRSEQGRLLEAEGRLWLAGVETDSGALLPKERRLRVPLPGYPFEGKRYWVGEEIPEAEATTSSGRPRAAASGADATPSTPMEKAVAEIFRELLGSQRVGAHDDFFELGGSSLMAVQLGARLREVVGREIPASLMLEATTVASLAQRLEILGEGGEEEVADILVPLRSTGSQPPLFLVHQVGGNVFTFRQLTRLLGANQPVYGLRSPGLEVGEEPLGSIQAMADCYLEKIRQIQPRGPYRIGGASMGGLVAFEIARRLLEGGEKIALLVLMDSPLAQDLPTRPLDSADLIAEFFQGQPLEICAEELRSLGPQEQIRRAIEASGHEEVEVGRRVLGTYVANASALYAYEPEPLEVPMLYFRARERREMDAPRPELSWIELAWDGVEVVLVPGDHETMHEAPGAERMVKVLKRRL